MSPSTVRAFTAVASPDHSARSIETSSTCIVATGCPPCSSSLRVVVRRTGSVALLAQLLGVALEVLDAAAHEERLLGVLVELAVAEPLERVDGLLDRHERPVDTGELLGDERVLREEPLDAPRAAHQDAVLLG